MRQQTTAVLGAGGRAGQAITRALAARGRHVTAVVRNVERHRHLANAQVDVVGGDATRAADLTPALADVSAVVVAVTPFSVPPPSFDGFDEAYFANVVDAIVGAWPERPHRRMITVGLAATVELAGGTRLMDDAQSFPPRLLPFARAHAGELPALRRLPPTIDWLRINPPAGLQLGDHHPCGYVLLDPPVQPSDITGALSYAQLAEAVADEIENPTANRKQVAIRLA